MRDMQSEKPSRPKRHPDIPLSASLQTVLGRLLVWYIAMALAIHLHEENSRRLGIAPSISLGNLALFYSLTAHPS